MTDSIPACICTLNERTGISSFPPLLTYSKHLPYVGIVSTLVTNVVGFALVDELDFVVEIEDEDVDVDEAAVGSLPKKVTVLLAVKITSVKSCGALAFTLACRFSLSDNDIVALTTFELPPSKSTTWLGIPVNAKP
jgi:hypothetical protein